MRDWVLWTERLRWLAIELISLRTYFGRSYSFGHYLGNRLTRDETQGERLRFISQMLLELGFRKRYADYYDAVITTRFTALRLKDVDEEGLNDLRCYCASKPYREHRRALIAIEAELGLRHAATEAALGVARENEVHSHRSK